MKLPLTCMQCMTEGMESSTVPEKVEFNDDNRYEFSCSNGHTSIVFLQQERFEILFEIGAYAINDGYYREAVSSFTSSLERFYEFFIKVICFSRKIDWIIIKETWKSVSSQSERQLGAFLFLYLQEFGEKPPLLHESKIKFRNAIIHKGKIPNKEEAIEYGQAILDLVRPLLKKLKEDYHTEALRVNAQSLFNSRQTGDSILGTTLSIPTILSIAHRDPTYDERGLREILPVRR